MVANDQPGVPAQAALPTDPARRLTSLDVLRGFAVLGILLMNIGGWAFPDAMPDPFVLGFATRIDYWVYGLEHVFVEGTMRALFSMLFGAGVVLITMRLEEKQGRSAAVYYRRTIWLIVFGLVHAYILLWPGDILYTYGVVGLLLYFFRKLSPRVLILLACGCVLITTIEVVVNNVIVAANEAAAAEATEALESGQDLTEAQQKELDEWNDRFASAEDPYKEMNEEIEVRRSGYLEIAREASKYSFEMQTKLLIETNFLDAAVAMLLGMALLKLGVLSGERTKAFYAILIVGGYTIGLPMKIWEGWYQYIHDYNWVQYNAHWYTYDISRLAVSMGHVGVILLFVRSGFLNVLTLAVAAVGRMALTNYIMHSVLCGLIFYGFGLGLVARLTQSECLMIAVGIWILQLILSPLWLHFFRFGPLEWLWRTLTYMRLAPMKA